MRHTITLFLSAAALVPSSSLAQGSGPERPALIAEGELAFGTFVQRESTLDLADWHALLPNSMVLSSDLSRLTGPNGGYYGGGWYDPVYRSNGYGYSAGSGSGYAGVALDLDRRVREGSHFEQRLRFGISTLGTESMYGSWGRSLSGPFDTLVSQTTGDTYVLDTVWSEQVRASASRSRIALDASFLLRRVSASRWSWYVGAGVLVGTSYNGRADVLHTVEHRAQGYYTQDNWSATLARESHRIGSAFFGAGHVLAGLDFKLGRTSPFWSSLHLFYEVRPMLTVSGYPGISSVVAPGMQHLFGLRFDMR